ncbi:MAG: 3-hydroxyacyl-CoA dehydrogenase NAD-binding domain-containing protein [Bacteroidetes bacterium]|nr:3-hydroxyacyl-CoA dehydrogenase NAD-binding domain-containing protein [Bacteroidota bacterium]
MNNPTPAVALNPFKRVAVLGAGTMGAQIAAHFANAGLSVDLLDIAGSGPNRNEIVEKAFKRMTALKPDPFYSTSAASRIRLGNFEDHLERLKTADWVVEAVLERLDVKSALFERVEAVISDSTIVSTNTSGIPIHQISKGRSESFQKRFLGTHFFNPPRYLKLCEVISGPQTDPRVVEQVSSFIRVHLGKGVVHAKDSPYFIGNRIGIFAMMLAMKERSHHGFSMDEVDLLTGTLVGHPKSATFRTADVVGLDVMQAVISNLKEAVPEDEARSTFTLPAELEGLVKAGRLGAKTKAGYYQKVGSEIFSHDAASGSYVAPVEIDLPGIGEISKIKDLSARLKALYSDKTKIGESFRRTTLGTLAYAARRIPEVSDSIQEVDNAIKWGFGWEMGPFEIWDTIGFQEVVDGMKAYELELPKWVSGMKTGSYYSKGLVFSPQNADFVSQIIPKDEALYFADSEVIAESEHTLLRFLTQEVAILEFRSKANTLGNGVVADLVKAVRVTENHGSLKGLVIANAGSNFSVGANLAEMGMALMAGKVNMIDAAVRQFQMAMEVVRNSLKPVVVVGHGRVLGGATELMLSCRTPLAVAESYLGLVELGVGLIPAGTGCLRLMELASLRSGSGYPNDIQTQLAPLFQQVAMAKVSSSAAEAVQMGYLSDHSPIIMREERRFYVAAVRVCQLFDAGYLPPVDPTSVRVLGAPGRAAFESMAFQLHQGRFISDYDLELANGLAFVMTGGDLPGDALVPRSAILDLERETFMRFLGQKKTQERIRHLLETGSPLRN